MALERVNCCPACQGTGNKRKRPAKPRRTVICNYRHKHVVPAKKAYVSMCKECGGDGWVLEHNFGRQ